MFVEQPLGTGIAGGRRARVGIDLAITEFDWTAVGHVLEEDQRAPTLESLE
ncbi:hypothetical protein [Haloterrigena salifodinae]|uniref:hypothetical protein n=1 Tax=Haloterrigena salifodinae TaxID=2675099 RepID=UPI001B868D1D|nr:hypothetical protein [Haloterrigena salifodinae]